MTAAALPLAGPLDRRTLLRAAALGAGMMAAVQASPALWHATRASLTQASTPGVADWEPLLGHAVSLRAPEVGRVAGQVVDVRAHPQHRAEPAMRGEAYSLLLDAPALTGGASVDVVIQHPELGRVPLTIMPVNGDGSWEGVIDRRTPARTTR